MSLPDQNGRDQADPFPVPRLHWLAWCPRDFLASTRGWSGHCARRISRALRCQLGWWPAGGRSQSATPAHRGNAIGVESRVAPHRAEIPDLIPMDCAAMLGWKRNGSGGCRNLRCAPKLAGAVAVRKAARAGNGHAHQRRAGRLMSGTALGSMHCRPLPTACGRINAA